MKILFSANSFEGFGGVEQSFIQWIDPLQSNGHELTLQLARIYGKHAAVIQEKGVTVVHHRLFWSYRGIQIPNPFAILKLALFIRRQGYDAIIGLQPPAHYFLRFSAYLSLTSPRVVAMERLSYSDRAFLYVCCDRILEHFTSSIICVSPSLRNEFIERSRVSPSKIKAIAHGFYPAVSECQHSELLNRAKGRIIIGCVARITSVKRQRLLLRAFRSAISQSSQKLYLVLVGDTSDDTHLQNYVETLGITNDVWIMGHSTEIDQIYNTLDIFTLPSVREGFGRSWAEAMSYGIPVITTNIPPMSDYLTHDLNSILFTADDEDSLLKALIRLIGDPELRTKIGASGRILVEREFNFERQVNMYISEFTGH